MGTRNNKKVTEIMKKSEKSAFFLKKPHNLFKKLRNHLCYQCA